MKNNIEFIPYGEISASLTKSRWWTGSGHGRMSKSSESKKQEHRRIFVTYSQDLDATFIEMFRERATQDTRLLILNKDASTDRLLSHVLDLQIRTPQRCYVVEGKFGIGKSHFTALVLHLLKRFSLILDAEDSQGRILDARIENGILHVVSPNFDRMDVPIDKIKELKNQSTAQIEEFEIEEEGSFIYWPVLDLHLGWNSLQQLVNPEAALKVSQKSEDFNRRYGRAVQRVREKAGLKPSEISGISEKQLRRIENGECRLTSNAIEALSKAHDLGPNEYMKKLAVVLA